MTGALRIVLVGVGVAAVVYGVSGLSGYFVPVVRLVPIPLGLLLTLVGAWPRWPGGPSP